MIKGKVIIIFYETKDVVGENRKLKDELNKFYDEQSDAIKELIVKLPIINCSSAFWPFTGIWKSKLRENSKKEGIMIYGDWDGKMKSDYKTKDKESNVDKKGIIKYFASGKVEDKEIDKIKELLKKLVNER
jgi:predicted transcriptional regulator